MKGKAYNHTILLFLMGPVLYWTSLSVANTYTVTKTDDSGPGTLRQAMTEAETHAGADTITFQIPDTDSNYNPGIGVWIIQPESELTRLDGDSTFIDGTSQRDFIGSDTNPSGPEIVLDGQLAGNVTGINIWGNDHTVKGLVIHSFHTYGIGIGGNRNTVQGCYIGTDATGTQRALDQYCGILMRDVTGNLVGGSDEAERNVISGNTYFGIRLENNSRENEIVGNYIGINSLGTDTLSNESGVSLSYECKQNVIGPMNVISGNRRQGVELYGSSADSNSVIGNYIGTDSDGSSVLGNGENGIKFQNGPSHNTIGGNSLSQRNVISGNKNAGIYILSGSDSNLVTGNYIGCDGTGMVALPNHYSGIILSQNVKYNRIGGIKEGESNVISGNDQSGLYIESSGTEQNQIINNLIGTDVSGESALKNDHWGVNIAGYAKNNVIGPDNVIAYNGIAGIRIEGNETTGNSITQNSIFSNEGLGIDNYNGGNTELQPPVVTAAGSVSGTAPAHATVEIFSTADDEGQTYHETVTADNAGNWMWSGTPTGPYVTATATDGDGNTSEFSDAVMLTGVERNDSSVPGTFSVHQNYPNPFNPKTTIQFYLPKSISVSLKIYDLLGTEVETLVNGYRQAGEHRVEWNGEDFPSGIYLYRLEAGSFIKTGKLILQR